MNTHPLLCCGLAAVGGFVGLSLFAGGLAWKYLRLPAGPSRLDWGATVFGHRGCRFVTDIPENTIPAFEEAYRQGCGGVECDVRLTRDGELVVFHDLHVGQQLVGTATQGNPRVDELSLAELRSCTFAVNASVTVPTLEETVQFVMTNKLRILIEIKEVRRVRLCTEKIHDLFTKYRDFLYDNAVVISFNPFAVYGMRALDGNVAVGQLYAPDLFRSWDVARNGPLPRVVRVAPGAWDVLARGLLGWLSPRLSGCSMICPKFVLYTPHYRRKWVEQHRPGTCIYLWGFPDSSFCTDAMRQPGVCVSGDDHHRDFAFDKTSSKN